MARKKENPTPRHATAEEQNVMGLRSAVVEQPVTETLENNYMPYAMSVIVGRALPDVPAAQSGGSGADGRLRAGNGVESEWFMNFAKDIYQKNK